MRDESARAASTNAAIMMRWDAMVVARVSAISGSPHQRRRRCATRADKREERDAALAEMEWRLRKPEGDCCPEKAETPPLRDSRQRPAAQYRLGTQKMPERGD